MQQDQQHPKGWTPIQDAQNAASFLVLAAQALAAPVEVFLRTAFGRRYFGVPAFLGFLAVPMWMLFWPEEDPEPLLTFWVVYIAMQLRARIESVWMAARGSIVHTRYNGRPRLTRILRRTPEHKIKSAVEPWLVILTGVFTLGISLPLGSYLMASGTSLMLVASVIESVECSRALTMHDAWLEQQDQAERFRELQNHRS